MVEAVMVLRGRDGEDPVIFTCTPMCCRLCVCDCGVMFFFSLSLLHSLQVLLWQCEGCGLRVGGWGERRATETGSTSTGAQEEWPLRQTLVRQRDKTEHEWILIAFSQVAVDNVIVALTQWSGTVKRTLPSQLSWHSVSCDSKPLLIQYLMQQNSSRWASEQSATSVLGPL